MKCGSLRLFVSLFSSHRFVSSVVCSFDFCQGEWGLQSLHPAAKARARLTLHSFYEDKIHTSANVGTPATNDH